VTRVMELVSWRVGDASSVVVVDVSGKLVTRGDMAIHGGQGGWLVTRVVELVSWRVGDAGGCSWVLTRPASY
jgi:hypothetical protein